MICSSLTRLAAAVGLSIVSFSGIALAQQAGGEVPEDTIKAAKAEKSLMIYHTAPTANYKVVFEAFQKKYGIKVENFHATGSPLATRFSSEAEANQMQADVLSLSESPLFTKYAAKFQKLSAANIPNYVRVADGAKLDGGLAVSPTQASFVFSYNTQRVKESDVPSSWEDLVNPKWKGETLLVDPRSSATYRLAFNVLRKRYPDLLPKMAANSPRLVESGTPAVQQLAAGTGSIAYIHYGSHADPLMAKGAPIKWVTIEKPELTRSVWLGATQGKNPNAARLFVNFMLSDEALTAYCKAATDVKSTVDPTGKRTGCQPFSADVVFLPDEAVSKEDTAAISRDLKLD